jgi:hypothetical protein
MASALLGCKSFERGGRCGWASLPLHHPMIYNHHTRGQGFLSGAALSHHAVVGGRAFPGHAKPPGLDI